VHDPRCFFSCTLGTTRSYCLLPYNIARERPTMDDTSRTTLAPQTRDITGRTFGLWTVRAFAHSRNERAYWHTVCKCGTERIMEGSVLRRGVSVGCGCPETKAARVTYPRAKPIPVRVGTPPSQSRRDRPARRVYDTAGEWTNKHDEDITPVRFGFVDALCAAGACALVALPIVLAKVVPMVTGRMRA
jgi:hypothetical protein